MSKNKEQTVTNELDPNSKQFVEDFLRPLGERTAGDIRNQPQFGPDSFREFFSPFQEQVIDTTRADFDQQRAGALTAGAQQATASGARGSRQGVLQAQLLNDVNRSEASALARLRERGFGQANQLALQGNQSNIQQLLAALQAGAGGIGPTGNTQTQTESGGGLLGTLGGAAQIGAGLLFPPAGAAAAAAGAAGSVAPSFSDSFQPFQPDINIDPNLFARG